MKSSFSFDLRKSPDGQARESLVQLIEQLESMTDTTPKLEELAWEIRLYRFMLEKDPAERLRAYLDTRRIEGGGPKVSKRETARRLGWEVL